MSHASVEYDAVVKSERAEYFLPFIYVYINDITIRSSVNLI